MMPSPEEIRQQLEGEVERLSRHAATTTNPCTVATMIAVTDERVKALLVEKLQENVFRGVRCLAKGSVLFRFDCPPGVICLISPSFLVRVNIPARKVIEIIDPFDEMDVSEPPQESTSGILDASTGLLASSKTTALRKITVSITNVADRAIEIDGHAIPFGPGASSVQAQVAPGLHSLDWFVQAQPGTEFTLSLTGATVPISFSGTVSNAQQETGRFHFTVA